MFIIATPIKKNPSRYKVMFGCECCISDKSIHSSLLSWRDRYYKNSNIKAKILKTEGLGKKKITYMKHIKYSHATWASYLSYRIWYGKGKNLCVSTVRSWVTTLEMCIAMLCEMSKHKYSWPRNRWSVLQHDSFNYFSHLSSNCALYNTWHASVKWQERF